MTAFYYYLVLVNAAVSVAVAGAVYWKNRHQPVGLPLGIAMFVTAIWLVGFAHYFAPVRIAVALVWAQITLSCAIISTPFLIHGMVALADRFKRLRWWVFGFYAVGVMFLGLLWSGHIIAGVKPSPYMHHYIHYNRTLYPVLGAYLFACQAWGAGVLIHSAWRAGGYKRTQLVYFAVAWFIVALTGQAIIIPLEYDINIPPLGFFVMPLNFAFLAYVMGKARLADYNIVIARAFIYAVTMVVVAAVSFAFLAGLALVAPGFMNQQQLLFSFMLAMAIGVGMAFGLPKLLPRAERMMQERLFGSRGGYHDALQRLVQELSLMASIDEALTLVVGTLHTQMQVSRVLVFMQDSLSGKQQLRAQSGLTPEEMEAIQDLPEDMPIVQWLGRHQDSLVRDELPRRESAAQQKTLTTELDRYGLAVCTPMTLDGKVVGMICLGPKANTNMFFVSDLRMLENLATEVGLAVKYRKMEEEIFRKNKLIELGTVAAGVAHEIRNPLASIRTFAQLMPEQMDDPEFKNEFSKLVLKDVDRITKVVESMLAFARPSQVTVAAHAVTDLVEEAILLAQPRVKAKRIELTKRFHETPIVNANKQQILQVLINLISNAADALPERGKISIATGVRLMEADGPRGNRQRCGVIEVTDNGPGIPAAIRTRLFDPFFTTKKEGTGLGLSISQKIVRDHGGIITVNSVEGKGTTFQVSLPLAAESPATPPAPAAPAPIPAHVGAA